MFPTWASEPGCYPVCTITKCDQSGMQQFPTAWIIQCMRSVTIPCYPSSFSLNSAAVDCFTRV